MSTMVGSLDARLVFRNALKALDKAHIPLSKAILSQSYLRLEVPLNQTVTNYEFSVLVNQQNAGVPQFPTEYRLNLQDSFYVSHMGMFLMMAKTAGGNTSYKDYLMSFPSAIFNGAWNPYGMYNFYNGNLNITVNNRVLIPAWDIMKHLYVPETQVEEWIGVQPQSTFFNMLDELDGSQSGFYPVEPNIVLIGSKNNQITLNVPHSFGADIAGPAGPSDVRAVLFLRGVLAQNSTSVH